TAIPGDGLAFPRNIPRPEIIPGLPDDIPLGPDCVGNSASGPGPRQPAPSPAQSPGVSPDTGALPEHPFRAPNVGLRAQVTGQEMVICSTVDPQMCPVSLGF